MKGRGMGGAKAKAIANRAERRAETLVDEIKDEIDRLHDIGSPALRQASAKDLVEYIQLHHLDGAA